MLLYDTLIAWLCALRQGRMAGGRGAAVGGGAWLRASFAILPGHVSVVPLTENRFYAFVFLNRQRCIRSLATPHERRGGSRRR
ncbi:MAG: hypothetical protein ACOVN0_02915, partial [Niveispirillum sp.]|uniref:hypothetical protein n=1 Tax=Niveispirillum sp. TaxID=1917217 RepID=UPI003BA6EB80